MTIKQVGDCILGSSKLHSDTQSQKNKHNILSKVNTKINNK